MSQHAKTVYFPFKQSTKSKSCTHSVSLTHGIGRCRCITSRQGRILLCWPAHVLMCHVSWHGHISCRLASSYMVIRAPTTRSYTSVAVRCSMYAALEVGQAERGSVTGGAGSSGSSLVPPVYPPRHRVPPTPEAGVPPSSAKPAVPCQPPTMPHLSRISTIASVNNFLLSGLSSLIYKWQSILECLQNKT